MVRGRPRNVPGQAVCVVVLTVDAARRTEESPGRLLVQHDPEESTAAPARVVQVTRMSLSDNAQKFAEALP